MTESGRSQIEAIQASLEKITNQINFESKQNGIPQDKKFLRLAETCFDEITKAQNKLLDAMISKNQRVQQMPFLTQKSQ